MAQKLYELTCLFSPELNEEQAQDFAQKIEAKLEAGKIVKSESPKKTGLSYPIKKQTMAFLSSVIFEAEPQAAEKIKKNIEKEERILRFLLVSRKSIPETTLFVPKEKPIETTVEPTKPIKEPEPATAAIEEKKPEKKIRKKKAEPEETKIDLKQIEEDLDKILDQ